MARLWDKCRAGLLNKTRRVHNPLLLTSTSTSTECLNQCRYSVAPKTAATKFCYHIIIHLSDERLFPCNVSDSWSCSLSLPWQSNTGDHFQSQGESFETEIIKTSPGTNTCVMRFKTPFVPKPPNPGRITTFKRYVLRVTLPFVLIWLFIPRLSERRPIKHWKARFPHINSMHISILN